MDPFRKLIVLPVGTTTPEDPAHVIEGYLTIGCESRPVNLGLHEQIRAMKRMLAADEVEFVD